MRVIGLVRLGMVCLVMVCLVMWATPAAAQPAKPSGTLIVTVVDQSGGVLPAAEVTLAGMDDTTPVAVPTVLASEAGVATLAPLQPGRYVLRVTFPGFAAETVPEVRVRAGENRRTITLRLQSLDEEVTVPEDPQSASLDIMGPTFSTVLTREMIDALPDDPDEMAAALEAMAPPGATFRVDGFSGGRMPHKSQIKSVRLPRTDAMAAQNHGGVNGFLVIEIRTQPGAGPFRGSVEGTFFDEAFTASNPFAPVKGDEQTRQVSTYVSSTILPNRTSFSASYRGLSQYTSPTLLAVRGDGTTLAAPLRRPQDVTNVGIRVDHALNRDHALRVSFDRNTRDTRNQGTGGFNLPDRGFRTVSSTDVIRLAEGGALGKRFYTESRLQVSWESSRSEAAVEVPAVRVIDAFTSGGAQVRGGQDQFEIEAASDLDYVRGAHSWRVGGLIEGGRYRSDDMSNYLGTYTFASLAAFNAGQPSTYTRRVGDPNITYSAWQTGVYLQDDWRVARSVLLSAGVRAGVQTLVSDPFNLSPRVTAGWSPFRGGKLTLRASYGYLYDWISGSLYKQTELVDGFRLRELNVSNPSFPDPPPAGATSATNRYLWSDDLALPTSHRLTIGADRQLTAGMRTNVSYTWGAGMGQLRGRNRNAPVHGVRPDAAFANVIALVSDAEERLHAANVGWNLAKPAWKRSFFAANYTWTRDELNTTGAFAPPASGDRLEHEWGPTRPAHVATASMNITPARQLNVNLTARGSSGAPYNVTIGRDVNLDGLFNDRPAGTSRNSARTAAHWDVNGKVSYAWRFGPPASGANSAATPNARLRIDVSLQFQNLLNRANYVGYSGVMTSPFFGRPTGVANPRRVQLGLRFGF